MPEKTKRISPQMLALCWVWIVFCAAYLAYGYATYSGLYRWLADMQVSLIGRYVIVLTGVVPFLILSAPALSILRRDYLARHQGGATVLTARARDARAQRTALVLVALASLCFIVSGATWWIGKSKAVPAGEPVQLDLRNFTGAPPEGRVTVLGTVQADRGVTTMTEAYWQTVENFYAPMVAPDEPSPPGGYRVFIKRSTARTANQPRLQQMFLGTETGILVPGGLPAEVRAILARGGVRVAEPHWLLTAPSAANDHYYTAAGIAGLSGLILLIGGAGGALGARFRARRHGG